VQSHYGGTMNQRALAKRISLLKEFSALLKAATAGTEETVVVQRVQLAENADLIGDIAEDLLELVPEKEITVDVAEEED
jgi:hypothetical protein